MSTLVKAVRGAGMAVIMLVSSHAFAGDAAMSTEEMVYEALKQEVFKWLVERRRFLGWQANLPDNLAIEDATMDELLKRAPKPVLRPDDDRR